jgi:Protein kinase domain/LIM domain
VVSWCRGVVVSWCRGVVVSWCRGVVVSWCRGVVVSWCRGVVVSWCRGVMVSWCRGVVVPSCRPPLSLFPTPPTHTLTHILTPTHHPSLYVSVVAFTPLPFYSLIGNGRYYCEDDYIRKFTAVCHSCNEHITTGPTLRANGKAFHPEHFACSKCDESLRNQPFFEKDDQLYCRTHFEEANARPCAECSELVLRDGFQHNGDAYHKTCLSCAICNTTFGATDRVHHSNGNFFCHRDFLQYFGVRCNACGDCITDRKVIYSNGENYHPDCFKCFRCHEGLQSYICIAGSLRCERHANAILPSEQCAICEETIELKNLSLGEANRVAARVFGKMVHTDCLQCCRCSKHLKPRRTRMHNDAFWCRKCMGKVLFAALTRTPIEELTNSNGNAHLLGVNANCERKLDTGSAPFGKATASLKPIEDWSGGVDVDPEDKFELEPLEVPDKVPVLSPRSTTMIEQEADVDESAPILQQLEQLRVQNDTANSGSPAEPNPVIHVQDSVPAEVPAIPDENNAAAPLHHSVTAPEAKQGPVAAAAMPSSQDENAQPNTVPAVPAPLAVAKPAPLEEEKACTAPPARSGRFNFRISKLIGSGSFGKVYEALDQDTGVMMAVKKIVFDSFDENYQDSVAQIETEIDLMKKLKHVNVVKLLGAERNRNKLYIFMEYVPSSSLHCLIEKYGALDERVIRQYTKQILRGLAYCHSHKVIHRDIKSRNILVNADGVLKLCDFGAAKQLEDVLVQNVSRDMQFTPLYTAPEILRGEYSDKVDIWSLGCCVTEMATGKQPWAEKNFEVPFACLFHIGQTNEHPLIPDTLSDNAKDFLLRCYDRNVDGRPNAMQLLQHPWMNE